MAEGVATAFSLVELIDKTNRLYRRDLSFPIIYGKQPLSSNRGTWHGNNGLSSCFHTHTGVKEILEGKRTPAEGLKGLMTLPLRPEMWNWP